MAQLVAKLKQLQVWQVVPVVLVCVAVGWYAVILIMAAGPAAEFVLSNATLTGSAQLASNAGAIGGQMVVFGSAPAPTPTPTPTAAPTPTPTPTSTPTAGCTGAANHVPDGADGTGTCWPGPNNTGPNAAQSSMATYSGSCTISAANTTIDSKVIHCAPLTVAAAGLVIKNSYLLGGVVQNSPSDSYTIQDSLLDNAVSRPACSGGPYSCAAGLYACGDLNNGTVDCGVTGSNFTLVRTEVTHTIRGAYCESTCLIQDNYFHGANLWPDKTDLSHASGVRNEQYLTLRHNTLSCDFVAPGNNDPSTINDEIGCSADMSGYPDFAPIMHDTIDHNLFLANNVGIGFCMYGGGTAGKPFSSSASNATYIVVTNNVFQRGGNGICGAYGPVTDFISGRTGNVWSGNKYDNGATVPPG
ncbi:MAG TPA: hypothetical protein VLF67_05100 [Candidatus Saccharimonas sp.]|nr:hypothetical protein [Candidatus Saccharimonas sp.]